MIRLTAQPNESRMISVRCVAKRMAQRSTPIATACALQHVFTQDEDMQYKSLIRQLTSSALVTHSVCSRCGALPYGSIMRTNPSVSRPHSAVLIHAATSMHVNISSRCESTLGPSLCTQSRAAAYRLRATGRHDASCACQAHPYTCG